MNPLRMMLSHLWASYARLAQLIRPPGRLILSFCRLKRAERIVVISLRKETHPMRVNLLYRLHRYLALASIALIAMVGLIPLPAVAAPLSANGNLFCFPTAGTFIRGYTKNAHNGFDISSTDHGKGGPIYAPYDGTVVYVGGDVSKDNDPKYETRPHIVAIDHGWFPNLNKRVMTTYGHMGTPHGQPWQTYIREDLKVGDSVHRGSLIGYQGEAGNVTGTHLHWEIHENTKNEAFKNAFGGTPINPQLYTGTPPNTIAGADVCSSQTTPTEPPLPPSFIITAGHSGKCLDVDNWGKQDGANVWQWSCHSGANQQWRMEPTSKGYIQLVNVNSGKCLDVNKQSRENGANIQQWSCNQGANQQWWRVELQGTPFFFIKSRLSDKCLDVAEVSEKDGANVHQWDCTGGDNQKWAFLAPGSTPPKVAKPAPQQPAPVPQPVPGVTPQPAVPAPLPPVQQPPARPVLTYIKLYKSGSNVYGNFCIDADSYTLQWGSVGRWDSGTPRSNGAINGCRTGVWFFSGVTDARETLWVQVAAKAGDLVRTYKVAIRDTGSSCQLEQNDTPLKKTTECVFTNG